MCVMIIDLSAVSRTVRLYFVLFFITIRKETVLCRLLFVNFRNPSFFVSEQGNENWTGYLMLKLVRNLLSFHKKSFKISKGQSESVYRRRTDKCAILNTNFVLQDATCNNIILNIQLLRFPQWIQIYLLNLTANSLEVLFHTII